MRGNRTAFIGTGFMARAMIGGIVDSGVRSPSDIFTVNPVDRNSAVEVSSLSIRARASSPRGATPTSSSGR